MKNFTKFFTFLAILLMSSSIVNAQCLDFAAGPWADLGSAQCAEDCAAGPIEAGYQAWTNEAYVINEAEPGAEYVFSICDGHDSSVWAAELTAAEYDGTAAIPDAVFATVQDCEITFTVPADYDAPISIIVVVADLDDCGGASQETDNGFVTFGCGDAGGQQACGGEVTCADGASGTVAGTIDYCFGEVTDFTLEGAVIPTEGESFGHFWIITTEDISGSTDPLSEPSYLGNFPIGETPISPLGTANDGGAGSVPPGVYYLTSIVFANGTADVDGNLVLDPTCTFASESFMFNFFADGECGGCPTLSYATTCVDGDFFVEVTVAGLGDFPFFDLTDGTTTVSVTETGVAQFGPYATGTEVTISASTGDAECDEVSPILTDDCAAGSCLDYSTGPYTDFNTATPSPLDCANGLVELAFQAWTNEAYIIEALPAGQPFAFSICNGYDASVWSATLSVVDAVDPTIVYAQAEDCLVSFTLDAPGDVIVVVANSDDCGGGTEETDNGFVAFGCDAAACAANAGGLVPPASTTFVEGETLTVSATDFQESPDYGYAYVMTDGAPDYNIVEISYNGQFELISGGDFTIHGLSIVLDELDAIQDVTTGVEVLQLIDLGLCADLLVDESETFTVSVVVGIEDNNNNAFLNINQIVPVPASNAVTVDFSSKYQNVTVQVTDLTGRIIDTYDVNTTIGNNTLALDINNYAAGVYMLNLRSAEASVNAKFVKQ
ncbi:MAG: T9SS type A sorting domain-containing protein [Chitinophagales bacterium]